MVSVLSGRGGAALAAPRAGSEADASPHAEGARIGEGRRSEATCTSAGQHQIVLQVFHEGTDIEGIVGAIVSHRKIGLGVAVLVEIGVIAQIGQVIAAAEAEIAIQHNFTVTCRNGVIHTEPAAPLRAARERTPGEVDECRGENEWIGVGIVARGELHVMRIEPVDRGSDGQPIRREERGIELDPFNLGNTGIPGDLARTAADIFHAGKLQVLVVIAEDGAVEADFRGQGELEPGFIGGQRFRFIVQVSCLRKAKRTIADFAAVVEPAGLVAGRNRSEDQAQIAVIIDPGAPRHLAEGPAGIIVLEDVADNKVTNVGRINHRSVDIEHGIADAGLEILRIAHAAGQPEVRHQFIGELAEHRLVVSNGRFLREAETGVWRQKLESC